MTRTRDVVILGGGMAGLTAALQLKQRRPSLDVTVIEKRGARAPDAAFKVGESMTEIGSIYLRDLGLERHLDEQQLRKMGLRFFCPQNGNHDIASRVEYGLIRYSPIANYQLDRGRFENALTAELDDRGIELLDGATFSRVEIGNGDHRVEVKRNGVSSEVRARWIVDASGRRGVLRRQLGLGIELPHDGNAAWFRVRGRLRVDDWCDDPRWQARVPGGTRWLSTCHLAGDGYWVWLIALSSGCTSVGVVAEPESVPFATLRRYEQLIEWLREHEPQLAAKLPDDRGGLLDFKTKKHFSYGVRRVVHPRGWSLSGEAGLFLDPLYSTGTDFIAIGNSLMTELILARFDDAPDFASRLKSYNRYFLKLFASLLPTFQPGQLRVFRDPQAIGAKVVWDNVGYFMVPLNLFAHGLLTDVDSLSTLEETLARVYPMNVYMQQCFAEWAEEGIDLHDVGFAGVSDPLFTDLFHTPLEDLSREQAVEKVLQNVSRLEAISRDMCARVSEATGWVAPEPPYGPSPGRDDGEPLLSWRPYEERTAPLAAAAAQPADGWMIR